MIVSFENTNVVVPTDPAAAPDLTTTPVDPSMPPLPPTWILQTLVPQILPTLPHMTPLNHQTPVPQTALILPIAYAYEPGAAHATSPPAYTQGY